MYIASYSTGGHPKTIGTVLIFTFTHADGAALPVLSVAVTAVFVAGEGGTLDTATHLAAMLVPPAEPQTNTCYSTHIYNSFT